MPTGYLTRASGNIQRVDVVRRNNVVVTGNENGPVVLLAHGFGCDQNLWGRIVPDLAERCRVVLFDHTGCGRSDVTAWDARRYRDLDAYADDVLAVCHALGLEDVALVGHSVSAMIAVLAANREPERFAKLVLLTPSPCYVDDDDYRGGFSRNDIDELLAALESNYLGWSAAMAPVMVDNPDRPELAEELQNSFCRTDPAVARVFAKATFLSDNRDDLAKVSVPTLVIQCAVDAIAPPEVGRYTHERISGSELVTLDAIGHCPQLSAPEITAETILAFVAP